jgi:hypothetical protein
MIISSKISLLTSSPPLVQGLHRFFIDLTTPRAPSLPFNMKTTGILSGAFALLVASAVAVPTDYYPSSGNGNNKGKGHGKGGNNRDCQNGPFKFTSTYNVVATPDQVVNGTTPTGGLPGCTGFYDFGINSELDLICWNIKLVGFRGEYQSLARTATHIHQGARGASGPPRMVFPNPVGNGTERYSYGCMTGK